MALPLVGAAGVGLAVFAALWIGDAAPGAATVLAILATVAAVVMVSRAVSQASTRARVAVVWAGAGQGIEPQMLELDPVRDAGMGDFASWTAILFGVAGLLANGILLAFGAPGLPFPPSGLSLAAFFGLLCIGLYARP